MTDNPEESLHQGSCHCGAVKFEILTPKGPTRVSICNCSMCSMKGYEHLIVPKDKFTLKTSWDAIKLYTFGTHTAQHYFCGTCGITPFYVPRSNPNGYSVNFRCVDRDSFEEIKWDNFDGQNWEEAYKKSDIKNRA